jgi:hypothetical protein
MCEWNPVPREKLRTAVTGSAGVRQIFLGYGRGRIARGVNLMHEAMAGHAARGVRVARRRRLSVYALPEFLHFLGMALRAFCRRRLGRSCHLMWIAVARLARAVSERAVDAVRHMGSLVGVASRASNLRHSIGVRKILDGGVTVATD